MTCLVASEQPVVPVTCMHKFICLVRWVTTMKNGRWKRSNTGTHALALSDSDEADRIERRGNKLLYRRGKRMLLNIAFRSNDH